MRGPKFTLEGAAPETPLAKKNLRGSQFTLRALHPKTPLAEKLSFPKNALDPI